MKRLLIAWFLFVSSSSFSQVFSVFTISGTFEDIPHTKLYLWLRPFNGSGKLIDSAYTAADGSYRFLYKAKEQNLYLVGPKDGLQALFTNDAPDIKINLTNKNFRFPDIKGSEGTQTIYRYLEPISQKNEVYKRIDQKLDSLQLLDNVNDQENALRQQREAEVAKDIAYAKALVRASNSPAAIFYIIRQEQSHTSTEELLQWVTTARKRFKVHSGLTVLYNELLREMQPKNAPIYGLQEMQAPELVMPSVDGTTISVSSFRGKYLLLDFWASWCVPCRKENPNVLMAYNKYKEKNFTVLGVSLDDNKESWLKAIEKDSLPWPQMSDLKFWKSRAVETYHFNSIPFNVLIDPSGKIIANSLRGEELEKKLTEIL